MKIKQRTVNVLTFILGLVILIVIFNKLKSEEHDKQEIKQEIKKFHTTKDSTIRLVDDFVFSYQQKKEIQKKELDSLNQILVNNKMLSKKEMVELRNKIKNKSIIINEISQKNIIEKDSIIYNTIKQDTIIYDTIIENTIIRDTFYFTDTLYKIDTIFYKKEDIKRIKFNN
tara:strand:- start:630 stop:1142 length:513 start_codon:yes stop_codon:yes gene_type:complete